jgi:NADPH2:quinone reductase
MKAIRINTAGGAEVLSFEDVAAPVPQAGSVRVRVAAAGLNFIDVYQRTGLYPVPLPFTPGLEGAGTVDALGPGVTGLAAGDAVAWSSTLGSYAEQVVVPADRLVKVPTGVDPRTAAAVMLQGMTAHYLTEDVFPLKAGDTCLVHAAAGGVGLLLVQMAKRKGARVFGTVSTEEKAALARQAGADQVILYTREDFVAEVKRGTEGRGVAVVYDSVGKDTFGKSLNCLRPRGLLALFGFSSGGVPPFDPAILGAKGSLFLTRPGLNQYIATREELLARTDDVFNWLADGRMKVRIEREYPLAEAADAHRALEARQTSGKVLLVPDH